MTNVFKLKAKRDPRQVFEILMQPHFSALYGAARRMSGSVDDAEDLVQEVCIKAFAKLDQLESMDYPKAWLLKTLYHHFIDDQRRAKRSPLSDAQSDDVVELIASEQSRPDIDAEQAQQVARVFGALKLLGSEASSLVAMHDIDGVSLKEIQAITDLPLGTIKSKLHRARSKLGKLLQRQDFGGVQSFKRG